MVINYLRTVSGEKLSIRDTRWNMKFNQRAHFRRESTKLEGSPFRKFLLPRFSEKLFINLARIIPRGELNRVPSNIFLCVIKLISCSILPLGRPIYLSRRVCLMLNTIYTRLSSRITLVFAIRWRKIGFGSGPSLGKRLFSFLAYVKPSASVSQVE